MRHTLPLVKRDLQGQFDPIMGARSFVNSGEARRTGRRLIDRLSHSRSSCRKFRAALRASCRVFPFNVVSPQRSDHSPYLAVHFLGHNWPGRFEIVFVRVWLNRSCSGTIWHASCLKELRRKPDTLRSLIEWLEVNLTEGCIQDDTYNFKISCTWR